MKVQIHSIKLYNQEGLPFVDDFDVGTELAITMPGQSVTETFTTRNKKVDIDFVFRQANLPPGFSLKARSQDPRYQTGDIVVTFSQLVFVR